MTYTETLKYMLSALPMFQRVGAIAYKADLRNAYRLDKYFGHNHKNFKTIHIAGTNGKGSVSHMLAAVLQSAGYKTGLFTSPHLVDFRERIRINGKMISKKFVVDFFEKHTEIIEKIKPSFFELSVFLAFDYFNKKKIDVAIIETGLGGRLDTTNIITPELSVITNISKDHTHILGDTIEKIAIEKAGIIKPKIPVVIGEYQNEITHVFIDRTKKLESLIYFASDHFEIDYFLKNIDGTVTYHLSKCKLLDFKTLASDLIGFYQKKNICTALMSLTLLIQKKFDIQQKDIEAGIRNTIKLTGFKGRWQVISNNPLVICDTGHNEDGISAIIEQIHNTAYRKLHMIVGFVSDKDLNSIIKLFPKEASYYLCQPDVPRAKNVDELYSEFIFFGLNSYKFRKVHNAFKSAFGNAHKDDLIFIGGSNFVVADFLKWKKNKKSF